MQVEKEGPRGVTDLRSNTCLLNCKQLWADVVYSCTSVKMGKSMADYRLFGCILIITLCLQGISSQCVETQKEQGLDCSDIWQKSKTTPSGVYTIKPDGADASFLVYCEMKENGGWTLMQNRNGLDSVHFDVNWNDYEEGFGRVKGEHWLGLKKMSSLTNQRNRRCKLNIALADFSGNTAYAEYGTFRIGLSATFYQLLLGSYSGTAGDSFKGTEEEDGGNQYGMAFSTADNPHDNCAPSCATGDMLFKSCSDKTGCGWWFNACGLTNLNGLYHIPPDHQNQNSFLSWPTWKFYESLKSTNMSVNCN